MNNVLRGKDGVYGSCASRNDLFENVIAPAGEQMDSLSQPLRISS